MSAAVTYTGEDRTGTARTGRTGASPEFLIEKLFAQGWLWAIATREGVKVGAVEFDGTGHRTWWAEA